MQVTGRQKAPVQPPVEVPTENSTARSFLQRLLQ
jgi:hypothetical protein